MSIMDVDLANEKLDYEVLYKKRFEEIENTIEAIQQQCSLDNEIINKLSDDVNFLKNEVFRHNDVLYNIRDNMDAMRVMLNQLLPENQQIFFKYIF